jgi:hypothetical protein
MRNLIDTMDYRPCIVGTIGGGIAQTVVGNAIDTIGFSTITVFVTYACIGGTATNVSNMSIRFQEADVASTVANFSDITDGQLMGSMKVTVANAVAPSNPYLASTFFSERIGGRKRYLRPIVTGSNQGCEFAFTIGALLGKPVDTLYIAKGTTFTTYNAEYGITQI